MGNILLIIHLLIALALIGMVLLQRSEGGGLGIGGGGGGGGGGMGGFMTGRGTANLLTRVTAILAALFICTSLALAKLAGMDGSGSSILDEAPLPVQEAPVVPEAPSGPSAPIAR